MNFLFLLFFLLLSTIPSFGGIQPNNPYSYSKQYITLNSPGFEKPKSSKPHGEIADFSSWNLPFSVLGPDANPLNALPSALGGRSPVGTGNLVLLFQYL